MELNEVNDILDEDVDNSDLAQLLPPDEETRVEETKRTSILLNETVPKDPQTEAMSMSWILPLPQMDEHLGGRCLLSHHLVHVHQDILLPEMDEHLGGRCLLSYHVVHVQCTHCTPRYSSSSDG